MAFLEKRDGKPNSLKFFSENSSQSQVTLTKAQDKKESPSPLRENIIIERDWTSGQACALKWASESKQQFWFLEAITLRTCTDSSTEKNLCSREEDIGESKKTDQLLSGTFLGAKKYQIITVATIAAGRRNSIIISVLTHLICVFLGESFDTSSPILQPGTSWQSNQHQGWLWQYLASRSVEAEASQTSFCGVWNWPRIPTAVFLSPVCTMTLLSKGCSLPVIGCSGGTPSWETQNSSVC